MRRYPYEYYARYLLIKAGTARVSKVLRNAGFGEPDEEYLKHIRSQLVRTRPSPYRVGAPEADRWVREQRVFQMQVLTPEARQAKQIVYEPLFRPVIEMLLLSGLTSEYISHRLKFISGKYVDPKVIDVYGHYMWNRNLMTRDDWEKFLTTRTDSGYLRDKYPNGKDLFHAYLGDPQVAMWKVGLTSEIDERAIIDQLLTDAHIRILELRVEPNSVRTAKIAEAWSKIIFQCLEERNKGASALRQALDKLQDMSLKLRNVDPVDGLLLLENNNNVVDLPDRGGLRELPPGADS